MASTGMSKAARIALVVTLSVLAIAIAAAAVIAGVVESGRSRQLDVTATTGTQAPKVEASLAVVRPTAAPAPTPTPAPVPTTATEQPFPPPAATTPERIETVQARPPVLRPPAEAPFVCPAGTVISGLTDITVGNERYSTTAQYSTLADITGHGSIRNGTTSPVKISLSTPSVKGLDVNGRQTLINFGGGVDFTPAPGVPRPYEITVGPGESVTYTVTATEVQSATIRQTTAWYADPASNVGIYADLETFRNCHPVPVSAPARGPSIMNTYVPWGP